MIVLVPPVPGAGIGVAHLQVGERDADHIVGRLAGGLFDEVSVFVQVVFSTVVLRPLDRIGGHHHGRVVVQLSDVQDELPFLHPLEDRFGEQALGLLPVRRVDPVARLYVGQGRLRDGCE